MRRHRTRSVAILSALIVGGFTALSPAADNGRAATGDTEAGKTDASKANGSNHQIEAGARQIGRGIEDGVKGVGRKIEEGVKEVEPRAKSIWQQFKEGVADAGRNIRAFFKRHFNS